MWRPSRRRTSPTDSPRRSSGSGPSSWSGSTRVRDLLPVELSGEAHLGRPQAADACGRFCRGLVDAVAPYVVGVKPQVAFFEALGADGLRALEDVCAYAHSAGLQVIADAKRGDIGSTARAYAAAFLEPTDGGAPLADAVTVNPYLGRDSLDPFLAVCRRDGAGIFCVVKTSNAGGTDIQDLALSDGRPVWQQVAELVAEWGADLIGEHGLSAVGAVIGATHPRAVGEARRLLPRSILLLPGVGAQGGEGSSAGLAVRASPSRAWVRRADHRTHRGQPVLADEVRARLGDELGHLLPHRAAVRERKILDVRAARVGRLDDTEMPAPSLRQRRGRGRASRGRGTG